VPTGGLCRSPGSTTLAPQRPPMPERRAIEAVGNAGRRDEKNNVVLSVRGLKKDAEPRSGGGNGKLLVKRPKGPGLG